jgi:hypothetical protein
MPKAIDEGDCNLAGASKGLVKLLRKWRSLAAHEDWGNDNDCSWWYGERASVSQLAGAAWALDGWAMQEYAWTRGVEESHARIDLAVEHKSLRLRFIAEAKQIYPFMTSKSSTVQGAINKAFHEASWQLDQVNSDDWDRIALVFVSPCSEDLTSFGTSSGEFVKTLRNCNDPCVWTFPAWARKQTLKSVVTDLYYPGAVLIARHVLPTPRR